MIKRNRLSLSISAAMSIFAMASPVYANAIDLAKLAPASKGQSVIAMSSGADVAQLLIYGPIGDYFWEGVSARQIVEQIDAVTAPVIKVRIDSDGGEVTDGVAIYNALKSSAARVEVVVEGIAASIASLIAMAGDSVAMHENTVMMIHAPSSYVGGNAMQMRDAADMLDTFAAAMLTSYVSRANNPAEVEAMLSDGKDHYLTAAEAMALGLVDSVIASEPPARDSAGAAASLLSYVTAIAGQAGSVATTLRRRINAVVNAPAFARLREAHQRAIVAYIEDQPMKHACNLILAQAGAASATVAATASGAAPAASAAAVAAAAGDPAPDARAQVLDQVSARNESLRGVFAQFRDITGIADLEARCLADARMTVEAAQGLLLARVGSGGTPLQVGTGASINAGTDQVEKTRDRVVAGVLARAGALAGREADEARQDNPAARQSLIMLAEQSLIRAGVNTRQMSRDQIASAVLAQQGTSDFPIILENTLNKLLLRAYALQPFTWNRFCSTGTLSDYRPHNRYHMGSFSDLKPVNQAGEYENGVLSDANKETITGSRKGRILQLTPEVLVNDDLGAFTTPTQTLGRAAGRTIENDVYALFALNAGAGPTMSDGLAMFHADHSNIAGTGGAPSVALVDAMRQQMGSQLDPGGNDYLDLIMQIWLGPLSLGSTAREINAMEFNDESQKNQRRPNVVRGLYSDVVDTPRLSGTAWYGLADPNIEPVFEVAFLDGVQTPTLEQEKNFRTDGLAWKVVHRYGVAGVGTKGIIKNAGV